MSTGPAEEVTREVLPSATARYSKDNPWFGRLLENRVLNRNGSSKDVRHLVIDIGGSGLSYKAGDSLGVYPRNRPQLVTEVIKQLGVTGSEQVVLPRLAAPLSLCEALTDKLSLVGPTRNILESLVKKTTSEREKYFLGRSDGVSLLHVALKVQ